MNYASPPIQIAFLPALTARTFVPALIVAIILPGTAVQGQNNDFASSPIKRLATQVTASSQNATEVSSDQADVTTSRSSNELSVKSFGNSRNNFPIEGDPPNYLPPYQRPPPKIAIEPDENAGAPSTCWPEWFQVGPTCSALNDRFWLQADYLLWWTEGSTGPPLVTTSPVGTPSDLAGVLGEPGTQVLFGDSGISPGAQSGGRITIGWWLLPCECQGIEASYLGLPQNTKSFSVTSAETPILARPYFDTQTGSHAAMLVAYPNLITGSIAADASTAFQSAELLWQNRIWRQCNNYSDFLIGYRYADLNESLRISQFSEWTAQQGPIIPGTTKRLFDQIDTTNQFNGIDIGFAQQQRVGRWSLESKEKIALGSVQSVVKINGSTTTTVPGGGSSTFVGGLLAQQTNIGRYDQNHFAVMPELGCTLGYDLTCRLRATLGYSFLYLNKVARPANQIDTSASQLPPETPTGTMQPAFRFAFSDFWAQGLNLGIEYQF